MTLPSDVRRLKPRFAVGTAVGTASGPREAMFYGVADDGGDAKRQHQVAARMTTKRHNTQEENGGRGGPTRRVQLTSHGALSFVQAVSQ